MWTSFNISVGIELNSSDIDWIVFVQLSLIQLGGWNWQVKAWISMQMQQQPQVAPLSLAQFILIFATSYILDLNVSHTDNAFKFQTHVYHN